MEFSFASTLNAPVSKLSDVSLNIAYYIVSLILWFHWFVFGKISSNWFTVQLRFLPNPFHTIYYYRFPPSIDPLDDSKI
jgi:hypothetical protein